MKQINPIRHKIRYIVLQREEQYIKSSGPQGEAEMLPLASMRVEQFHYPIFKNLFILFLILIKQLLHFAIDTNKEVLINANY